MSRQFWTETLAWNTASGTQISNSTTETIIHPNVTIPANYMQDGRAIELFHFGMFSNVVTTPGTLTFRIRWGGVAGTILAQSAAISLSATAQTNVMYELEALIITRANGSSGSVFATGAVNLGAQLAASNNQTAFMGSAGASAPAAVTVDLTADTALSLTAQFSVATNPTNLTGLNYVIKALN